MAILRGFEMSNTLRNLSSIDVKSHDFDWIDVFASDHPRGRNLIEGRTHDPFRVEQLIFGDAEAWVASPNSDIQFRVDTSSQAPAVSAPFWRAPNQAQNRPNLPKALRRISELRHIAESEGLRFSEESGQDLKRFLLVADFAAPSLFLLENGNLRAVWSEGSTQIGIQFLGENRGQFILLDGEGIEPHQIMGTHNLATIQKLIEGSGIDEVWRARTQRNGRYHFLVSNPGRRHTLCETDGHGRKRGKWFSLQQKA